MAITPESVRELLQSQDYGDRMRAINQIRSLDPQIGFELLQLVIADSNPRIRYAAVSQMATLGHQDIAQAETVLRTCLTSDPEPDVQAAAADSIGALGLTDVYDDLANLYAQTSEWLVQLSIVAALGELGNPDAFELLQEAVSVDNELISTAALGALGDLGDERALPILLSCIDSPDWQVRHRLVQALSHFSQPSALDALKQLSQDESPIVAEAAAHHLEH